MRIQITKQGVYINHGLNDEGRLEIKFKTNDHIVVEVDEAMNDSNDLEFRTGEFIVEGREGKQVIVRQKAYLTVRP